MNKKILLDTNILLDAAIGERPGWAAATLLIDEVAFSEVEGYVAALSLKDVYYVLTKYADEAAARQFIGALMELFEIVAVDSTICRNALESDEKDFEDGLVRACAETVSVDFIISRDERAFARSSVKRLSAQEYVDLFCDCKEVEL